MPTGVYTRTEKTKSKMSLSAKERIARYPDTKPSKPFQNGHPQFNTGKTHFKKGHTLNKGKIGYWKNKKQSQELIKKRTEGRKGYNPTEETKRKMSKARTGKPLSEQAKLKISGEKSHWWQGGISFKPYTIDWTTTLRISIRERDHYTCQLCKKPQGDIALHIHHIDYVKKNCNPNNLITLCRSCHAKTNGNRKYWENYFKSLINLNNL